MHALRRPSAPHRLPGPTRLSLVYRPTAKALRTTTALASPAPDRRFRCRAERCRLRPRDGSRSVRGPANQPRGAARAGTRRPPCWEPRPVRLPGWVDRQGTFQAGCHTPARCRVRKPAPAAAVSRPPAQADNVPLPAWHPPTPVPAPAAWPGPAQAGSPWPQHRQIAINGGGAAHTSYFPCRAPIPPPKKPAQRKPAQKIPGGRRRRSSLSQPH